MYHEDSCKHRSQRRTHRYSVAWYIISLKPKMYTFVHKSSSFISFFLMFVCISFYSEIRFSIRSVVKSNGTFVNSDFTSSDISLWSDGKDIVFVWLIKSRLVLTIYSNWINGDSILAKYFARWYEAVPMLEIQFNSCNSNSYNSKEHLNRTNSSVPSEFTSKPLQENSFNSNSHNSKNHLNWTNFGSLGRISHHVIRIFGFGV